MSSIADFPLPRDPRLYFFLSLYFPCEKPPHSILSTDRTRASLNQKKEDMPLRSSSTPILNSWISSNSRKSSPQPDHLFIPRLSRTQFVSFSASLNFDHSSTLSVSDPDFRETPVSNQNNKPITKLLPPKPVRVTETGVKPDSVDSLLWSSGFGEASEDDCRIALPERDMVLQTVVLGDAGGSDGGGGSQVCGGGAESYGSNGRHDSTDAYCQRMIEASPGNSLLLANYVKFLKEVRGDYAKAEEYCGILAKKQKKKILWKSNSG